MHPDSLFHIIHPDGYFVLCTRVANDCGRATCEAKQRVHGEAQAIKVDPAGRTPAAGHVPTEGHSAGQVAGAGAKP